MVWADSGTFTLYYTNMAAMLTAEFGRIIQCMEIGQDEAIQSFTGNILYTKDTAMQDSLRNHFIIPNKCINNVHRAHSTFSMSKLLTQILLFAKSYNRVHLSVTLTRETQTVSVADITAATNSLIHLNCIQF
jgi:hypothetical protein